LGGEKLKEFRSVYRRILFIFFSSAFLSGGFFIGIPLLSAQNLETPAGPSSPAAEDPGEDSLVLAERAIILEENPPAVNVPDPPGSVFLILRMILILVLAALAVYGVIFLFRRAGRPRASNDPYLKLLASISLAPGCSVHLVSLGSRAWLVGSGSTVTLLSEVEDPDLVGAMILEEAGRDSGAGRDFRSLLSRLGLSLGKEPPAADNIRKRRERLKRL
jgi:flagellar protein FliO/FliZ